MSGFEHLHLNPPTAAALERLGWRPDDPEVREATPTAARGHGLVAAMPPAPAYASPALAGVLSRLGPERRGLVLAPAGELDEWGASVHRLAAGSGLRLQVAHGTARATRRLRANEVDLLVSDPETAITLLRRSALKLEILEALVLAWPERWAEDEALAAVMNDLPKETQRVILTADPRRAAPLAERYARKALTVGVPAAGSAEPPPAGPVRTVTVAWGRRVAALTDLVETLDPSSLTVWTADRAYHDEIGRAVAAAEPGARVTMGDAPRAQVVIAFDPPGPERLRQLLGAGEVVLLVPPSAEEYVHRLAAPRRPLRLAGVLDAATSAAGARRAAIARAIDSGQPERALLTLAPLFERYDPAAVAAALFDLWTTEGPGAPAPMPDIPATARIYVGVGKKDGATVNDLVAVLTKDLKVERTKIGRVELREGHALVELPAQEAERIAGALNGTTIRRRRVTARVDRGRVTTRPGGRG